MNVNDLIDIIGNVQTAYTKVKELKNPHGIEMVYFHKIQKTLKNFKSYNI